MKSGRPSKTAEHNALFRALEARRPHPVVADRFAEDLLPWRFRAVTIPASSRVWRDAVTRFIDGRWPGVRPTVIARTRLIDETIADLVATTSQVVILGAGLDTRAWRLPALERAVVFEVDHPDTQRRKQALIRRRGLDRAQVRFIPTDFNLGRLAQAMTDAGFDRTLPTLFLWEGTTNYLDADAVDATLRWCAQAAAGSRLVFTYINADVLTNPNRYVGADRVFSSLQRADEPMTFGLVPEQLSEYLGERGLHLVSDAGAASFREAAYGAASRAMHGHEFYRVAHAEIGVPAGRAAAPQTSDATP